MICCRVGNVPCSRWLLVVCLVEAWSFFGSSTGLARCGPSSNRANGQVQVPGTFTLAATRLWPGAPCTPSSQQRHPAIRLATAPTSLKQPPLCIVTSSLSSKNPVYSLLFLGDSRELLLSHQLPQKWLLPKFTTYSTTPLPTTRSRPTTQLWLLPGTRPSSCTARLEMLSSWQTF